ncbi:MAG: response regulator [Aphanothece sp. CMT-3BRIN-NPC111]|jgi:diguanylate cyclase (GGDEF)-like protein|nr:response regulator [Aphanothece sp. CMT-3BRIN-NPC111]
MKILLVEDDEGTAKALEAALTAQHYVVDVASDGLAGWDLVEASPYDLLLLDVMLPKLDGINFCKKMRFQGKQTPIILLTVQNTSKDKIIGLDAGADDYVIKPFDFNELLARIRAIVRRGVSALSPVLEWGELSLDPSSCEVTYSGQLLPLTSKEYSLLELFLRNSSRIFSRGAIIEHLWSLEDPPEEQTVTAHIKGLRHKLKTAGAPSDLIETVYGLGYRLKSSPGVSKPTKQKPFTQEVPAATDQTQQQMLPKLAEIWEKSKHKYSQGVAILEQASTALLEHRLTPELQQQAIQASHKLAGALGIFGHQEGSRLAKELDRRFNTEVTQLNQAELLQIYELVAALRRECQGSPSQLTSVPRPVDGQPLLLIVDDDAGLAERLALEAVLWGMQAEVATDLSKARTIISSNQPDVVLLDLCFPDSSENGFTLLAELSTNNPQVPVVVFTAKENFTDRVKVARLGGRGFCTKPIAPAQVMETIAQLLQASTKAEAQVMVVDDDPIVLDTIRSLLEPWGVRLILLDDPHQFWETLESSVPDLLVLDVEMPGVNGIELCQVVRNDPRWNQLPVLFLSAHSDADTVHRVFAVGADDYISKPIIESEFVARILNRLERLRLVRSQAETDSLTGLSSRRKSAQDLNRWLSLAKRHHQFFCLVVLDLDGFRQINAQHGQAAGDQVLNWFGAFLRRSLREEDIAARWGGDEFVLGLYGMNKSKGVKRLSKLLADFHQQEFTAANGTLFRVSFSAGVAQYSEDGSDLQKLYHAADAALHQVKNHQDRFASNELSLHILPAG